jgi:ankyrin repeat protein
MRALHYASWQGKDQSVDFLLLKGSSPKDPAIDGNTPLHLACEHGHFDVVSAL